MTTLSRQLRVIPIRTPGCYQEYIGSAQLFDHYHKFYLSVNLSSLENSINKFSANFPAIRKRTLDAYSLRIYIALLNEHSNLVQMFDKIAHKRTKRGLVNALGSAIKFVTGNLDNNDLIEIDKNLEILSKNQESEITKISDLTSFAAHITKRYEEDITKINRNIENTEKILNKINSKIEILQILDNEKFNIMKLNNYLQIIERTINLAKLEIPNLELFTPKELLNIIGYLRSQYEPQQIIAISESHLFEILEQAKTLLLITNSAIIIVLKLPILKPQSYQSFSVFPLPNQNDQIMVPPGKYYLEEDDLYHWTDHCRRSRQQLICYDEINHQCRPQKPIACDTAKIRNNYFAVFELENTALLTSTKLPVEAIEKCGNEIQKKIIQFGNILQSTCDVIIGNSTYRRPGLNFSMEIPNYAETKLPDVHHQVNFREEHLNDLKQLRNDLSKLEEPSEFHHLLLQYTHISTTGLIAVIVFATCIIGCYFRKNLVKNLCSKRKIVTLSELKTMCPQLDEDAQI